MLGVIGVVGTCTVMVATSLRSGLARYGRRECEVMRGFLKHQNTEVSTAPRVSRPAQLLDEVRRLRHEPTQLVNAVNEALSDVDFETRGGREVFRSCARIAVAAGMAGACVEIALCLQSMTLRATVLAVVAFAVGLTAATSCAVIGQWATRGALVRRKLWDDFVRRLLNSELPETACSVRASGMRPTRDVENGQGT
jgi:hypothetical protein